ncbi:carboxylic acid reductase, partial [Mycolicibacterium sp.]
MSTDTHDDRLAERVAHLHATDPQFHATTPIDTITHAIDQPGLPLWQIVQTVLDGYGDRPALGQRSIRFDTDPQTGRTTAEPLPTFDTVSYTEVAGRVHAIANALSDIRPGDRVAMVGFTSVDYTTVDLALTFAGAVAVPLQTHAAMTTLRQVVAETEPVLIASAAGDLADAVELALHSSTVTQLIVFDYLPQLDDHRDALAAAARRIHDAGSAITVETLTDVVARGRRSPTAAPDPGIAPDSLALLIYTSGSTGAPKGAMYPQRLAANAWHRSGRASWGDSGEFPMITLNFLPMSHVMGRTVLYSTLGAGGTAYFAASSDLSTFLSDLALVRPTQLFFVPRIWDLLHAEVGKELDRRPDDRDTVYADLREHLIGGRALTAMTGSAPLSPELREFVEAFLDVPLRDGYGSTEAGMVFIDGQVHRPPVLDYKLVDVPDLGYFGTDRPHPRGELLVKSVNMFPGYYRRPEITAEMFDAEGFYRTGDVVAETGPDHLVYLDRRNNVLKLSQGEFVTISALEAIYGDHPLIHQIYLYGNSAQPYLVAVVVPADDIAHRADVKSLLAQALQETARTAELQSYQIPRDFLVETTPFTLANGLLTGIRKLARPKLKELYGDRLEDLYRELAQRQGDELRRLRHDGATGPVLDTLGRAAAALLGTAVADLRPDAHFTDLGGDSLSALSFANVCHDIFGVEVPVGVIVSPTTDLQTLASYIETERQRGGSRPTFASVHGRDATEVHARDLTLDAFLDEHTLNEGATLPGPATAVRTVLLTGATGFLGRYLALEWLDRMALAGGRLICLVRARDDAAARDRLDRTFDSGDPELLRRYRELAADHLEVIAGDKAEPDLGLDPQTWGRLAETVDLIVDPAALVNHVLPYSALFGPNVVGTAELIRLALTTRIKPVVYVSTIGVGAGIAPGAFTEEGDIRVISPTRPVDDSYANGYSNSKWAGEVLLREAHDRYALPVSVFRCDLIMADTSYAGQLNVPDMFTRLILSLVATGIAPDSFYQLGPDGRRQRAHYDGLPVEFIAEAIGTLGPQVTDDRDGFATYHVMNPYDDGIGLDEYVDWIIDAGYPVRRVGPYAEWLQRFSAAVRALPDRQRQASLLPLLHDYQQPEVPVRGSLAPTDRFRAAVQDAKVGPDKDIPHVRPEIIVKYVTDLQLLGL